MLQPQVSLCLVVCIRYLMHQLLYLLQLHRGGVALQDVSDSLGVSLETSNQLFVWRRHSDSLQLVHFGLQSASLVGQLLDHGVPSRKAFVAGFAVRELTVVTPSTLVAPGARHALHTGTLPCGTMTLLTGDPPVVAVTS